MKSIFKPMDWDLGDYLSFQELGESLYDPIELEDYINYIIPEEDKEEGVSPEIPQGGDVEIPESKTKGKSTIDYSFNDKDFVKDFETKYIAAGVRPDVAKILAVQKLLESRSGKDVKKLSELAAKYHNYGGVKYRGYGNFVTFDTPEYINGKKEIISDKFRTFRNKEEYIDYELNTLYSPSGNFAGALDGDVDHYLNIISGGGIKGLKYATSPDYVKVLKDMASKYRRGGILKAQSGVWLNNYNVPGDWYDYSGAPRIPVNNEEHWDSRNPKTGMLLKHPNHDTYYEMLKAENKLGNRLFTDLNGREYSFNEFESMTKGMMPGMKEKAYPEDLWSRDAKKLYGSSLDLAKRYYNKLKSLGADDVQAAAMIGVFMQESTLDHDRVSSKGATGIAQLLGDKYNEYQSWLRKNKRSDTAENQIEWVWDHMAYGKDYWHDYYISLLENSKNDFANYKDEKERDRYRSDWSKMKDSKFTEYNYEAFRDDFYNMTDPGRAAELFTWTFERPGDSEANIDKRVAYANSLYEYMTQNK